MKKITGSASAKVNLTLDVQKKNPEDARHPVDTILHRISLADTLELTPADRFELYGDFECDPEENLIVQAWGLVRKFFPDGPAVIVRAEKNIPIGAGLGGGSTNFATFVKLYTELFGLQIPEKLVIESGKLGSDIPFFFSGETCARGTHFGEQVEKMPFDFSGQKIWLHIPEYKNLTGEMYAQLTNFGTKHTEKFLAEPDLKKCGNAFDQFLTLDQKGAHLTGSGSAFFTFEPAEFGGCRTIETLLG